MGSIAEFLETGHGQRRGGEHSSPGLYDNPYLGLTLTFEINSNPEIRELKGNFGQYCAFYVLPK